MFQEYRPASPTSRTASPSTESTRPLSERAAEPVRATGLGSSLGAWLLRNRETPEKVRPPAFDLLRPVGPDELREHRLEVESRPERDYQRRWPGGGAADPVRLDYHGVGLLQVATHAHDEISTRGLGLMFPAHTVHARDSTAVVVGNNCELTQVDHVHIRQAVIAHDDALRSARVERVLAKAVPGKDNTKVVRDLRTVLSGLVDRPTGKGPARAERKLRADCTAEIYDCESVQLGDDAMTRLDSHYVVERTVIPAGALLADSEDLARRYVDLATGAAEDPGVLAGFLCDLVGAVANATDDNLLGYADGLPHRPATLLGLFGMASIDHMTSIMIGTGNELHTELELTTARTSVDDSFADRLSPHASPEGLYRPPPVPGARSTVPPPSSSRTAPRPAPPASPRPTPTPLASPRPTPAPPASPRPTPGSRRPAPSPRPVPTPPVSPPPPSPPPGSPPPPPPPPGSRRPTPSQRSAPTPPPPPPSGSPPPPPPTPSRPTPGSRRPTPSQQPTPTPASPPPPPPKPGSAVSRPAVPSSEERLGEGWW